MHGFFLRIVYVSNESVVVALYKAHNDDRHTDHESVLAIGALYKAHNDDRFLPLPE